jgi:hypothetical protein
MTISIWPFVLLIALAALFGVLAIVLVILSDEH